MKRKLFSADGLNLLRACVALGLAIAPWAIREAGWFRDLLVAALPSGSESTLRVEILMFMLVGFVAGTLVADGRGVWRRSSSVR